jgi:hypothetical protein
MIFQDQLGWPPHGKITASTGSSAGVIPTFFVA